MPFLACYTKEKKRKHENQTVGESPPLRSAAALACFLSPPPPPPPPPSVSEGMKKTRKKESVSLSGNGELSPVTPSTQKERESPTAVHKTTTTAIRPGPARPRSQTKKKRDPPPDVGCPEWLSPNKPCFTVKDMFGQFPAQLKKRHPSFFFRHPVSRKEEDGDGKGRRRRTKGAFPLHQFQEHRGGTFPTFFSGLADIGTPPD